MARKCAITKKTTSFGGGYSNRIRATKFNPTGTVKKKVNLQTKKIFIPSLNKKVKVSISTKGLRVLKKVGLEKGLKKARIIK